MALITNCLKKGEFLWTKAASRAIVDFKHKMTDAPILRQLDLSKVFEVYCDALGMKIRSVLSQEGHPIAFFSEKFNNTRQCYSNYGKKLYVVVQTFKHYRYTYCLRKFSFTLTTEPCSN